MDWLLLGLRLLATIILYTFLGLAFYIIWRDLKQAVPPVANRESEGDRLRVISAADASLSVGQTLLLQDLTLLGRSADNTFILGEATASEQLARLQRKNGIWWLENVDSQSVTKLNNRPISNPTPLTHGDLIAIGHICFRLETIPEQQSSP